MTPTEFSKKVGLPLETIRKYCREGLITCLSEGKRYYILVSEAEKEIVNMTKVKKPCSNWYRTALKAL